jgi:hypothetical protein
MISSTTDPYRATCMGFHAAIGVQVSIAHCHGESLTYPSYLSRYFMEHQRSVSGLKAASMHEFHNSSGFSCRVVIPNHDQLTSVPGLYEF